VHLPSGGVAMVWTMAGNGVDNGMGNGMYQSKTVSNAENHEFKPFEPKYLAVNGWNEKKTLPRQRMSNYGRFFIQKNSQAWYLPYQQEYP
jgi:hypothetical protein